MDGKSYRALTGLIYGIEDLGGVTDVCWQRLVPFCCGDIAYMADAPAGGFTYHLRGGSARSRGRARVAFGILRAPELLGRGGRVRGALRRWGGLWP